MSLDQIAYLISFVSLLVIAFINLKTLLFPNKYIIFVLFLGVSFKIIQSILMSSIDPLLNGVLGLLVSGTVLIIIWLVRNNDIGAGDVKLMASIGMLLGLKLSLASSMFGVLFIIFFKSLPLKNEMYYPSGFVWLSSVSLSIIIFGI